MPVPSTEEYFHASEAIYHPDHPDMATAAGLRPLLDRQGQPLVTSKGATIGAAYLDKNNDVIIAFQGTNPAGPSRTEHEQLIAGAKITAGMQPPEFDRANAFATTVRREAQLQGIDASHVFVTGHSLGGAEAEYVAQRQKIGGESFAAPGMPLYDGRQQPSSTGPTAFTNHVAYGDPIANFASDTLAKPLAGDTAHHYGSVHMVGQPADQAALARDVAHWQQDDRMMRSPLAAAEPAATSIAADQLATMGRALGNNLSYHSLDSSYAPALGIKPLPAPTKPQQHAENSPQDYWRTQAAAGMELARQRQEQLAVNGSGTSPSAPGASRQHADASPPDYWRAQAAAGLELARQRQEQLAANNSGQNQIQSAQRPQGPRLG